jgi:hypothetical protein
MFLLPSQFIASVQIDGTLSFSEDHPSQKSISLVSPITRKRLGVKISSRQWLVPSHQSLSPRVRKILVAIMTTYIQRFLVALDVVKTRIQNANFEHKISGTTVIKEMLKNEGVGAFFKGLTPKVSYSTQTLT